MSVQDIAKRMPTMIGCLIPTIPARRASASPSSALLAAEETRKKPGRDGSEEEKMKSGGRDRKRSGGLRPDEKGRRAERERFTASLCHVPRPGYPRGPPSVSCYGKAADF
eukprot:279466-Rhodomonas_salina.1